MSSRSSSTTRGGLIRVRDLPASPGPFVMLHCQACDGEFSASQGDYFLDSPDTVMRCDCTKPGRPLQLVEKQTTYTVIPVEGGK